MDKRGLFFFVLFFCFLYFSPKWGKNYKNCFILAFSDRSSILMQIFFILIAKVYKKIFTPGNKDKCKKYRHIKYTCIEHMLKFTAMYKKVIRKIAILH